MAGEKIHKHHDGFTGNQSFQKLSMLECSVHLHVLWRTSGTSGVMVTLKRYMDTDIPAIMAISRLWRGLPWERRPCWKGWSR